MRYRENEDDRDEDDSPKGWGWPVVVALAVGVPALLGALVVAGVAIQARHDATAVAPATYSREEWRAVVLGKTQDEVVAALGRPSHTTEGRNGTWTYSGLTRLIRDPVSGREVTVFFVDFYDARAVAVRY